jgi:hypothetical protein
VFLPGVALDVYPPTHASGVAEITGMYTMAGLFV